MTAAEAACQERLREDILANLRAYGPLTIAQLELQVGAADWRLCEPLNHLLHARKIQLYETCGRTCDSFELAPETET